jgi:co-chaperonin GroES (HSP10)
MSIGHGITGTTLQNAAAEGILRPAGPRLLLEAIWEEQAGRVSSDLMASVKLNIADAIAFRVVSISPEVPADKFAVGDIVLNVSISGERVNSRNDESPYLIVHHEDVAAVVPADAMTALLQSRASTL